MEHICRSEITGNYPEWNKFLKMALVGNRSGFCWLVTRILGLILIELSDYFYLSNTRHHNDPTNNFLFLHSGNSHLASQQELPEYPKIPFSEIWQLFMLKSPEVFLYLY